MRKLNLKYIQRLIELSNKAEASYKEALKPTDAKKGSGLTYMERIALFQGDFNHLIGYIQALKSIYDTI